MISMGCSLLLWWFNHMDTWLQQEVEALTYWLTGCIWLNSRFKNIMTNWNWSISRYIPHLDTQLSRYSHFSHFLFFWGPFGVNILKREWCVLLTTCRLLISMDFSGDSFAASLATETVDWKKPSSDHIWSYSWVMRSYCRLKDWKTTIRFILTG